MQLRLTGGVCPPPLHAGLPPFAQAAQPFMEGVLLFMEASLLSLEALQPFMHPLQARSRAGVLSTGARCSMLLRPSCASTDTPWCGGTRTL
eukprot:3925367-Rhodomonas_salina.1